MRLRVVTEFLVVNGTSPVEIHRCLRSMRGEKAVDVGSVRHWVGNCMSSEKDIGDRSLSS